MITVSMYTHGTDAELIVFEEGDLMVTSVTDGDVVKREDFDRLLESVFDIETKDLKTNEWYEFDFKRTWEDDGSGCRNVCYFELIETRLIQIESQHD